MASHEEEIVPISLVDGQEPFMITVSDIKQWFVCQRIVYYRHLLPEIRPTTYAMKAGTMAHEEVRPREKRRTMHIYGIPDGKRHFDVHLYSPELGLSGLVDMVIERDNELIPVDFKDSLKIQKQFKMQVATYGILLEHLWQQPVKRGFVYSLRRRRVEEVKLSPRTRRTIDDTIEKIQIMVKHDHFPPPPRSQRLCVTCEFRRFCNDVA